MLLTKQVQHDVFFTFKRDVDIWGPSVCFSGSGIVRLKHPPSVVSVF